MSNPSKSVTTIGDAVRHLGGTNTVKQAAWLCHFAQRDWTSADVTVFRDICRLLPFVGVWEQRTLTPVARQPVPRLDLLAPYTLKRLEGDYGVSFAEKQEEYRTRQADWQARGGQGDVHRRMLLRDIFQRPLIALLDGLVSPEGMAQTEPLNLTFTVNRRASLLQPIWQDNTAIADLFHFNAAQVLQRVASRVRRCPSPGCLAPIFVQQRQDQEFCSKTCGSRLRVQRFRASRKNAQRIAAKRKKGGSR